MKFYKGELFCGPGGLSLGAKAARVEKNGEVFEVVHKWANDIDEWACATFRHNICPNDPRSVLNRDVRRLKLNLLPKINAFAFGFPCNDFSIVGEAQGLEGRYGGLYTYGVKVLRYHQPDWFIAENVGGLESANGGQAFIQILRDLQESGYKITPHKYKFEEYGIPQKRHRIIIVGIRTDIGLEFRVPKRTHPDPSQWKTAKQALEEPPIDKDNAFNHEETSHKEKVIEMLSHIPEGQNAWYSELPEKFRLNVKGAKLSNIYRRLHSEEPAYTVIGSGGGGTHMYHYDHLRALTNRERARLQTFPDDFEFLGGKDAVRKQIGMAVPPEGAKIIVEAILKTFAGIEYDYEEATWDEELSHILEQNASKRTKSKKKGRKKESQNALETEQLSFQMI